MSYMGYIAVTFVILWLLHRVETLSHDKSEGKDDDKENRVISAYLFC